LALEQSLEGLKASRDSLETQQSLARRLDADAEDLHNRAKYAITESREEDARKYLLDRTNVQGKLKKVLKQCVDEKRRVEQMESNVLVLEQRAMEVDALLRRTIGAKAMSRDSSSIGLSMPMDDPLLRKFRDLGID
jgi:phage shock protein A